MENYTDPEEYLPDLNAAIQAARNVTFALQKVKSVVADFDEWYAPWQATLRADPVMAWMHDARTRLVHTGDLEARSTTRVRVVNSYIDATDEIIEEFAGPLSSPDAERGQRAEADGEQASTATMTVGEIVGTLRERGYPEGLLAEATVSVERRWEEAGLANRELHGALAHAYAVLANILRDAHDQVGADCRHTYGCADSMPVAAMGASIRPPRCMTTTRERRTLVVDLVTGEPSGDGVMGRLSGGFPPEAIPPKYLRELGRPTTPRGRPATILDLLPDFMESAKAILRTGDAHGWLIMYFRGLTIVDRAFLESENAQQKRRLAQQVAVQAIEAGATGIVEAGEVWMGLAPSDGSFRRPADDPARREAVSISVELASGLTRQALIPFERPEGLGGPVIFGETHFVDDVQNNFLAPLRALWAVQRRKFPSPPGASFRRP